MARLARCGGSSRWSEAIALAVAEARGLLDPRVRIAAVASDVSEALISKDSPVHAIAAGKSGWIYVATIGNALELRVSEHMRASRYLEAVLLDAAGSQAVESLADIAQAACGRAPANARFAPGYCGWRLGAQPALLRALSAEDLGVRVLPSNAMEPLKTTTGIVVAGVPESLRVGAAFCETCTAPGCARRIH
ncbi:MAG: hypothetical protein HY899_00100 [Deltaproteobacteria bacterium]|nr:hypothetical protein [Deltaproteobacteria bacterium]